MMQAPTGSDSAKLASRTNALVFMLVGVLIVLSGLAVSVSATIVLDVWGLIVWLLFGAIFLDAGWRVYRQMTAIEAQNLIAPPAIGIISSSARVLGKVSAFKAVLDSILLSVIVLLVYGTVIVIALYQGVAITNPDQSFLGLGVIMGYFLLLSPLFRSLGTFLNTKTRSWSSHYELIPEGLRIHFSIRKLGDPKEKFIADVKFAELTELSVLDFREARAFLEYQVGPDIALHMKGVKDMIAFTKRKIVRPSYYFDEPATNATGTLKLVGPDLFYLVNINNENYQELLEAYERSKSKIQAK